MTFPSIDERVTSRYSSHGLLGPRTLIAVGAGLLALIAACVLWPPVAVGVVAVLAATYALVTVDRTWLLIQGIRHHDMLEISDDDARAVPDDDLPVYTVLLPVFNEPTVIDTLLAGVGQLEYPADKLEILLLIEDDDDATKKALPGGNTVALNDKTIHVVEVPFSLPRTKPKACNYGMYTWYTRGEFVTIYDAEDVPDPLQLRRAVVGFQRMPDDVACLQARLGYFNERQNLLTRWFSLEYDQWFGLVLPGLQHTHCVLPLGGTSNHMKTDIWREVGGWDEYNVTEDADLGLRLASRGYRTVVLDSATLEEANSDVLNWIRQRSRWYKGYLQTMLVHYRHAWSLRRTIGTKATLRIISTTGGVTISSAVNVLFWIGMVLWIAGRLPFIGELFPPVVYYVCLILLLVGNTASIYFGLIVAGIIGKPYLWPAALLAPLYWLLQSMAAIKAIYQLFFRPHYWEKTVHGLTDAPAPKVTA